MTSDREPPVFPRVGGQDPGSSATPRTDAPLFTSSDDHRAAPAQAIESGPPGRLPSPRNRLRWAVAGVATVLVFVLVGGALILSRPRAGTPSVVEHYVPADTAAYVDVRLDMPGDQRDKLAAFMGHFPGFADPASFQQKIDEMLDQALKRADAGLDWQRDVVPWFGGQVGLYGYTVTPAEGVPPSLVAALTVKDRSALEALLDERLADHEVDTLDYQGQQIRTFTPDPGTQRVSVVVTDELVLVGPRLEDIQTALDVKAGVKPALAQDEFYLQQLGALHSDRLATAYYDMGRLMDGAVMPGDVLGVPNAQCFADLQAASRVKYVAEVRAEDDHFAITTRSQVPTGENVPPAPQNKANTLASIMPAESIAYAEFRQVGAGARALISGLFECVEAAGGEPGGFDPRMIEQFLGVAPEDYLDFVDDLALAVTYDGALPGGGLVATVDDEAVATQRVERLLTSVRALVAFGEGDAITVDEIDHNGAAVTVFTFAGVLPDLPPTSLAVSVANSRLYIGLNDFVTGALDRQQADSLGASDRFTSAIARAGDANAGVVYLDMARVREAIEAAMPDAERQRYETEAKPFLEPLTTVAMVNRVDNGILVGHVFLNVE